MPEKIIWSPLAKNDFDLILAYLQQHWDNKVVQDFIEILSASIMHISNNPRQFPLINKNVRKCVLTKHNALYYRYQNEYIDVLRIFDTRQDPKKLEFS